MVKQVSKKSEAANAGLKPHDVIMRVGAESIQTTADWDRALHANAGKMVQVLILRDRKQQILNLQVDSKHHSLMIWTDIPFQQECPEMAALGLDFGKDWAASILEQAQGFKSQFSQEQLDEWQRQAEQMRDAFKNGKFPEFTIDPKAMEEFRKQMEQFRQGFNADQFKMDPKQMEEWKHQMEEFRKSFPQNFHFDRKQLEQFRRQMEQWRELSPGQAA
jgi:membrane-associated protease RseP (regulator of RpoE activity)